MNANEVSEIIACMPEGRTLYHYFRDRYAVQLLSYWLGAAERSVREVKAYRFAPLLERPVVKQVLASLGSGVVSADALQAHWPEEHEVYLLTLGKWGDEERNMRTWYQSTRVGPNLVLQLNFSNRHNRPYRELLHPEDHPFADAWHPIAREGYLTLAWARIDVSLEHGEALIEEVQNDWLRNARAEKTHLRRLSSRDDVSDELLQRSLQNAGMDCSAEAMDRYYKEVLHPHFKLWDEAMLSAAIWFLRQELGMRRIFFHTFETGRALKGIEGRPPPKSIYSDLPTKFCFYETAYAPDFLLEDEDARVRKAMLQEDVRFYCLEV